MSQTRFGQKELAVRWDVSERTLEGWRWRGVGPAFLKLGGRVVYRLEDVLAYEAEHLHLNTAGPVSSIRDAHHVPCAR